MNSFIELFIYLLVVIEMLCIGFMLLWVYDEAKARFRGWKNDKI